MTCGRALTEHALALGKRRKRAMYDSAVGHEVRLTFETLATSADARAVTPMRSSFAIAYAPPSMSYRR